MLFHFFYTFEEDCSPLTNQTVFLFHVLTVRWWSSVKNCYLHRLKKK